LLKQAFKNTSILSIYITIFVSFIFIFINLSYTHYIKRADLFSKVISSSSIAYLGAITLLCLIAYFILFLTTSIISILIQCQFLKWGESKKINTYLPLIVIMITSLPALALISPLFFKKPIPNYNESTLGVIFFVVVPATVTIVSYFWVKKLNKNKFRIKFLSKETLELSILSFLSVIYSYLQIIAVIRILNSTILKYSHSAEKLIYASIFYLSIILINFFISSLWNSSSQIKDKKGNLISKAIFTFIFTPVIFTIIFNYINPSFIRLASQSIRTTIGINDLTIRDYSIPIDSHPINDYTYKHWDMNISLDKKFYLIKGIILLSIGDRSLLCPKDVKETFEKTINSASIDVEKTNEYTEFIKNTQQCHLIVNSDLR